MQAVWSSYGRTHIRFALLLGLFIVVVQTVTAQIIVRPIIREIVMRPGTSLNFSLTIANVATETSAGTIFCDGMSLSPVGKPISASEDDPRSCAKWLSFDATAFTLPPQDGRTIQCTIRAPRNALGGYYALVHVRARPSVNTTAPGARVNLSFGVDVALLVMVTGRNLNTRLEPAISEMKLNSEKGKPSWQVGVTVANKGNIHARLLGQVDIYDIDLKRIAGAELATGKGYVLPGGERLFSAQGKETLRDGIYTIRARLHPEGQARALATVRVVRIANDEIVPGETTPEAMAAARAALGEFTVETNRLDVTIPAGGARFATVTLRNRTATAISLKPTLHRWGIDSSGQLSFTLLGNSHDALAWVALPSENVELPANGTAAIRIHLTVPRECHAGDYFAAISFARAERPLPEDSSLLEDNSTLIAIAVGKPELPTIEIRRFTYLPPAGEKGSRVAIEIANLGMLRVWPNTRISITSKDGKTYEPAINLEDTLWALMPESSRVYQADWELVLKPGEYTAEVSMEIGENNKPIIKQIPFTVVASDTDKTEE